MSKKFEVVDEMMEGYLRDESRLTGNAETISFPINEDELIAVLKDAWDKNVPVTVQGALTGIAGGAVPVSGHIINLSKMNRIIGMSCDDENRFLINCQPGVILSELNDSISDKSFDIEGWSSESVKSLEKFIASGKYFFPPDPTETSASIGGMTACDSSGARTFLYGSTRAYIHGLTIILSNGKKIKINRGENYIQGRTFSVKTEDNEEIKGLLPDYIMPAVKNAAGYFIKDKMDIIDLFIGMEGTLGIISEIVVSIIPKPDLIWGMMAFFPDEVSSLRYVRAVRCEELSWLEKSLAVKPAVIEFFNSDALNLLRQQKKDTPAFESLQELPDHYNTAVYIEYHGNNEDSITNAMMDAGEVIQVLGSNEKNTWLADNDNEIEKLKFFRHAVPEAVNMLIDSQRKIDPEITKLGTDMVVPDNELEEAMYMYNEDISNAGLKSIIFGHIGNNHLHVNILPANEEEYNKGKELYFKWTGRVIEMGGSVSGEHGIGKLKTGLLELMYGKKYIREMRDLKMKFDNKMMLNHGTLFTV